jgi:hypothetical protein
VPRVLTDREIAAYRRDGFLSPVRVISAEEAAEGRRELEAMESAMGVVKLAADAIRPAR